LERCLQSIRNSEEESGVKDYEVVVAGQLDECDATRFRLNNRRFRYVPCEIAPPGLKLPPDETPPFWKNHCLNTALAQSGGDVLTFLDADSLVGPQFLKCAELLAAASLTRLCYRVCYASEKILSQNTSFDPDAIKGYPVAFEAYGRLDGGDSPQGDAIPSLPVYGNSQFSIKRSVLGTRVWDERYYGRGFEDLDMIRGIEQDAGGGKTYLAAMVTEPSHAIVQIKHPETPGFANDRWAHRNMRLYYGIKTIWVTASSHSLLEEYLREVSNDRNADRKISYQFMLHGDLEAHRQEMLPQDEVKDLG